MKLSPFCGISCSEYAPYAVYESANGRTRPVHPFIDCCTYPDMMGWHASGVMMYDTLSQSLTLTASWHLRLVLLNVIFNF